jgi:hypothetical protein
MSIPAHRVASNIERSVKEFLYTQFVVPESMEDNINNGDSEFSSAGLDKWVDVMWLSNGAGKKGDALMQIDVYTRSKGKVSGGDRYGIECARLAQEIYEAMHVDTIQLYDYAVPASPTILTARRIMVLNSDGKFREPQSPGIQVISGFEDGIARRTLTYRLLLPEDMAGLHYYDD